MHACDGLPSSSVPLFRIRPIGVYKLHFKFYRLTLNVIKRDFLTSVGTSIGVQPLGDGQEEEKTMPPRKASRYSGYFQDCFEYLRLRITRIGHPIHGTTTGDSLRHASIHFCRSCFCEQRRHILCSCEVNLRFNPIESAFHASPYYQLRGKICSWNVQVLLLDAAGPCKANLNLLCSG
jgi:hypothetical protein